MSIKKAQGLSLNTIVIAALALIVLIVLVYSFTGRLGLFSSGVKDTQKCERYCEGIGRTIINGLSEGADKGATDCKDRDGAVVPVIGGETIRSGDSEVTLVCCCEKSSASGN